MLSTEPFSIIFTKLYVQYCVSKLISTFIIGIDHRYNDDFIAYKVQMMSMFPDRHPECHCLICLFNNIQFKIILQVKSIIVKFN